ncbi:VirB4 family type IV secretion system protein, partial [Sulfoacidibacillus ferrooxidans]|uniref:VirB4 family type IV secretion system protein n=1 Tax=Sulfoacidibacillus ferrooxidans TaxID=2005001 RepID=UPI001F50EA71
ALPSIVRFGYLQRFFQLGADVHVSLHIDPADNQSAIKKRTHMMTRLKSEISLEIKAGTDRTIAFNQQLHALLEEEREDIRLGRERIFYVTIILSVSSNIEEEFQAACERIEKEGFEGFHVREAYKEHDIGFQSVAPLGENFLHHPIEMTGTALANAFPFTNSKFSHEYGVPIGLDFYTGHMNKYDAWEDHLVNNNMAIVGTSGSGKSFLIKGLIARSALFGIKHVLIDIEGEYTATVRALGGVSVRIDENADFHFNPFELEEEEMMIDGRIHAVVSVKEKISDMERLIITMAHLHGEDRIDAYAVSTINDILQHLYEVEFGFTADPDSLYMVHNEWIRDERGDFLTNRTKRPQPQFSHFYDRLVERAEQDPRLMDLVMRLRRFKAGGTAGMFDCQNTSSLRDVPVLQFDFSGMAEHSPVRLLGMRVLLEWVFEKFVKKNPRIKKRVVIDEAQKFLEQEDFAMFLDNIFRRIRKYSGSAVAATQDFRKFADNDYGRAIIQNSSSKVLLKQDKNDKKAIMDIFQIEEREFEDLMSFTRGQGRWSVGEEV